jgi:hypothetical protein
MFADQMLAGPGLTEPAHATKNTAMMSASMVFPRTMSERYQIVPASMDEVSKLCIARRFVHTSGAAIMAYRSFGRAQNLAHSTPTLTWQTQQTPPRTMPAAGRLPRLRR